MDKKKPCFPLFVDLSNKKAVVVGGGTVATRRVKVLLDFTEQPVVIAPEVSPALCQLEADGLIRICRKTYERDDIYDADLVLAATDDPKVNNDIYQVCKCTGIPVNVCSDKNKCDFYFPGIVRDGDTVIGITASGTDHEKAREITEKIRSVL